MSLSEEVREDDVKNQMFGPLSFEDNTLENFHPQLDQQCLLCDREFCLATETPVFLKHMFEEHNLVIEDFQAIPRFEQYINYWKTKFQSKNIETIVPSIKIEGTNQHYFILSTLLKDDKQIRHKIILDAALDQQEHERTLIDFKRNCIFCKLVFEGKIVDYFNHLSSQHNLQLGKPQNLVYVVELLNYIEDKFNGLICIYCEKIFTDRNVLKEHMRKKLHKRINPANRFYNKYYIINYLEPDRDWQHLQREDDNLPINLEENSDLEWSDWNEKEQDFVCLFCQVKDSSLNNLSEHMKNDHEFDFHIILNSLDYYQKVKLVNYIRRQIHINNCIKCDNHYNDKKGLLVHMVQEKHFLVPDLKVFDQPEFYFPTYENDTLLYYLEEINDADDV